MLLYIFTAYFVQAIPYLGDVLKFSFTWLEHLTVFIGKHMLDLDVVVHSGDSLFEYCKLLSIALLSLFTALVLITFFGKNRDYNQLKEFSVLCVRYFLGIILILYGIVKIFDGQFRSPDYETLTTTFGESTPAGLLWTFMGYSKPFIVFCGMFQIVAAYLLFFRRTLVLGSLLSLIATGYVAMLNLCYNIPVKIISLHLLLMAAVLVAPFIKQLAAFFVGQQATTIYIPRLRFKRRWLRICRIVLKTILIAGIPVAFFLTVFIPYLQTPVFKMDGIYTVQKFELILHDGPEQEQPLDKWKTLHLNEAYRRATVITSKNDTISPYLTIHPENKTFTLLGKHINVFHYKKLPKNRFEITGRYEKDSIHFFLKTKPVSSYRLMKTRFRWTFDYPD